MLVKSSYSEASGWAAGSSTHLPVLGIVPDASSMSWSLAAGTPELGADVSKEQMKTLMCSR